MKKLWNVTGFETEAKCEGKTYNLEPFSEVNIYNDDHYNHIIKHQAHLGIVGLDEEEGALNYKGYKKNREREGLRKALAFKEQVLSDEVTAVKEMRAKGAPETDKKGTNEEKFREEVRLLKRWLKEAGENTKVFDIPDSVVKDRPSWEGEINEPTAAEGKN